MKPEIFIASPVYGDAFVGAFVASLHELTKALERQGIDSTFRRLAYADIVDSRNHLLGRFFYESRATRLLFWDADMGFRDPALVLDMLALDKPVVGAFYPQRRIDLARAAGGMPRALTFVGGNTEGRPVKGFVKTDSCGTGLMLISRGCIEAMIAKLPEIVDTKRPAKLPFEPKHPALLRAFDRIEVDDDLLPEDRSFCYRWHRLCGGEIWANVSHRIQHVGAFTYEASHAEATMRFTATEHPRKPA